MSKAALKLVTKADKSIHSGVDGVSLPKGEIDNYLLHKHELIIGFMGYEPFTPNVSDIQESEIERYRSKFPIFNNIKTLKENLGDKKFIFKKLDWSALEVLQQRSCDLIIDPVMPSISRGLSILPYDNIRTNILVFPRGAEKVHWAIDEISLLWFKYAAAFSQKQKLQVFAEIKLMLKQIEEYKNGFSVTAGVVEQDILQLMNVSINTILPAKNGIIANIKSALENKHVVLCDYPSADIALKQLPPHTYERRDLYGTYGENNQVSIPAGMAFDESATDLRNYVFELSKSQKEGFPLALPLSMSYPPQRIFNLMLHGTEDNKYFLDFEAYWKEAKAHLRAEWKKFESLDHEARVYLAIAHGAVEREFKGNPNSGKLEVVELVKNKLRHHHIGKLLITGDDILELEKTLSEQGFCMPFESEANLIRVNAFLGSINELDNNFGRLVFIKADFIPEQVTLKIDDIPSFLRCEDSEVVWVERVYSNDIKLGRLEPGCSLD